MLIAQITDIHLGFEPGNAAEFNRARLDIILSHLNDGPNRPDLLIATGDLADKGDLESYAALKRALGSCTFPVHACLGNHDIRQNFLNEFPDIPTAGDYVQYVVMAGELRLVILDTLQEGRHGGAFCETRANWLRDILDSDRVTPTIIVMHHPPVEIGIEWMNTYVDDPWVANFTRAISGATNIKSILCGHIHRSISVPWQGTAVSICSSTAPQVTLDLTKIDSRHPDNRPMIIADPPAYALHYWNGREVVTHFGQVGGHDILARYDEKLQPLIRSLENERPK